MIKFRKALASEIPLLVEFRKKQLVDEGTPLNTDVIMHWFLLPEQNIPFMLMNPAQKQWKYW